MLPRSANTVPSSTYSVEEHVFTPPSRPERQYRDRLSADRDLRVRGDSCRVHRRVVVRGVNLLHLDSEFFTIRTVSQWIAWPHQGSRATCIAFHGAQPLIRRLESTAQQQRFPYLGHVSRKISSEISVQRVCRLSAVFENRLEVRLWTPTRYWPGTAHESDWCPP